MPPPIDPRVIQKFKYIGVSTTGVRQEIAAPPGQQHTTYASAQKNAAAMQTANPNLTTVEIWPPAPPCHNPSGVL